MTLSTTYYPQVFLKERKYIEKEIVRHVHAIFREFSCSIHESDEN